MLNIYRSELTIYLLKQIPGIRVTKSQTECKWEVSSITPNLCDYLLTPIPWVVGCDMWMPGISRKSIPASNVVWMLCGVKECLLWARVKSPPHWINHLGKFMPLQELNLFKRAMVAWQVPVLRLVQVFISFEMMPTCGTFPKPIQFSMHLDLPSVFMINYVTHLRSLACGMQWGQPDLPTSIT